MSDDDGARGGLIGESPEEGIDSATFEVAREELTTTFEYQVGRLQEIDTKAIEILKANLLLIGIVVTGGSILIQTDLEFGPFVNAFTVVGGFLLLASTGLAAVTYTASNLRGGLDADAVESVIAADAAVREGRRAESSFEVRLLRSYARWIEYNARVTAVNDMLATVTVLLVFVAFVYLAAGVVVAMLGLAVVGSAAAFLGTTVAVVGFTWFAYHMDHLGPEEDVRADTFEGIRLSKGASRRRGKSAFREMLGRPSDGDGEGDGDGDDKH